MDKKIERLHNFLNTHSNTPFCWGSFDCVLFAASATYSMCGVDLGASYRNKYETERQANKLIVQEGGLLSMVRKVCNEAGFIEWQIPRCAQRGDLAMLNTEQGEAMGIVGPNGFNVYTISPKGLIQIPLNSILYSWRIPCPQ